MRNISILIVVMACCFGAVVQALTPGNAITLVERDTHIPAHPAPGDSSVHLPFASRSVATVVCLDQQTGWVEIGGVTPQGGAHGLDYHTVYCQRDQRRWHAPTVAGLVPTHTISASAPERSAPARHLEPRHLHAQDGQAIYPPPRESVNRRATDYDPSAGFVVVASTDMTTGTGAEILASANYMVQQDSDPGSIFYHKLDTACVGAIGHSQGAGGVVNATNHSSGLIKTTVPIALPDQIWVSPGDAFYVQLLTVPILFLGGAKDFFIASPATLTGYYNQVPGAAAVAVLKGAGHNTIQQTGGGFLGYISTWMMYVLRNDNTARGPFVGAPPEINTNTSWQNQAEKNLP